MKATGRLSNTSVNSQLCQQLRHQQRNNAGKSWKHIWNVNFLLLTLINSLIRTISTPESKNCFSVSLPSHCSFTDLNSCETFFSHSRSREKTTKNKIVLRVLISILIHKHTQQLDHHHTLLGERLLLFRGGLLHHIVSDRPRNNNSNQLQSGCLSKLQRCLLIVLKLQQCNTSQR